MKISVVIPVKDRLELLRQTLESCARQTYDSFEIVIVDDGSEENVEAFVNTWRDEHHVALPLQILKQPAGGAPRARNEGLSKAKGTYINFLDSDNLAHPMKLERLAATLDTSDAEAVYCLTEFFAKSPGDRSSLWNAPDQRSVLDRFLVDDPVWDTCAVLWKRDAIERIGGWDEDLSCWQDWELHVRALAGGYHFQCVPEVLQHYRDHMGERISTSSEKQQQNLQSRVRAFHSACACLRKAGLLTEEREEYLARSYLRQAFDATTRRDLMVAAKVCEEAQAQFASPSLTHSFEKLRRVLRCWGLLSRWQQNPFRQACERMGWNVDDLFPESCWGRTPSGAFRIQ